MTESWNEKLRQRKGDLEREQTSSFEVEVRRNHKGAHSRVSEPRKIELSTGGSGSNGNSGSGGRGGESGALWDKNRSF